MQLIRYINIALFCIVASFSVTNSASATSTPAANSRIIFAETNPMSAMACKAFHMFSNTIVKAICGIVIVLAGIGFGLGKISWGIILGILIAMVLFFGTSAVLGVVASNAGSGGITTDGKGNIVSDSSVSGNVDVCTCNYGQNSTCQSPVMN